jgi:hypothetical protein
MQILDVEEIKSSSKIDLKDVSRWMSIEDACRPRALVTARASKEGCISLAIGGKSFRIAYKHDLSKWALFNLRNILFQNGSIKNTKPRAQIWNHQSSTP